MTPAELATAMHAAAERVAQIPAPRVNGLAIDIAPGIVLRVPNTSAARQKRYRDRQKARDGDASDDGALRHAPITNPVTKSVTLGARPEAPLPHTPSPLILPSDSIEETKEGTDDPRAGASTTERNASDADEAGDDDETTCPGDLAELAAREGALGELAERLDAPIESLRWGAEEFVEYWTVGGGTGVRKGNWLRLLREHLRRGVREGKLKPPGLVEHERVKATIAREPVRQLAPLPPVLPGAASAALAALGVSTTPRPPARTHGEEPASGTHRRAVAAASGEERP